MADIQFKVDRAKCVNCGRCVKDCLCAVLEFDEHKYPKVAEGGEERCIKCQHCFAVCPTGALSVFGKNSEESLLVPKEYNHEELLALIKSRRSVRQFKQENLPKDLLKKLQEMLPWIPTGVNNHGLLFTFIDDIDAMERFRNKTYAELKKFYSQNENSDSKNILLSFKDGVLNCDDMIFRHTPHMVIVSSPKDAPCSYVDPIIALSYIELYAQSLGIGTLWCGLATYCIQNLPELEKDLKIPENYKPFYCMLLGTPDIQYKRTTQPEKYQIMTYGKTLAKIEAFIKKLKNIFAEFLQK